MRRLTFLLALLAALAAESSAHMLAPSLLEVRELGEGRLAVEWRTPIAGAPAAELRPVLPAGCAPAGEPTLGRMEAAMVVRWTVECAPAAIVGRRFAVAGVAENRADVLLRVSLADGRRFRAVLRADRPDFVVPARERPLEVVASYLRLGVEHILAGFDHLLFVLGLLLLFSSRRLLLWTLTSFTAGHSVTLSLAALGFVAVPQAYTEVAIALSLFVLAVELTRSRGTIGVLVRRPWAMAAFFGLLHGLGFAGALAEIGLPAGDIPLALFAFNLGIELGQLAFVAAVLLLVAALARLRVSAPAPLRLVPVYGIGALAAFWTLERLAAIL